MKNTIMSKNTGHPLLTPVRMGKLDYREPH